MLLRKVLSVILCGALCSAFALENQKPLDEAGGESSDTPDTPDTRDTGDPSDAENGLDDLSGDFSAPSSWRSMFSFGVHAEAGAYQLKRTAKMRYSGWGYYDRFEITEKWDKNFYANVAALARVSPTHWFSYVLGVGFQGEYAQRSSSEMGGYTDDAKQTTTLYEFLCQHRLIFTVPQLSSKVHIGLGLDALMTYTDDKYDLRAKHSVYVYDFVEVSYTIDISNSISIDVGARGGAQMYTSTNYINDVDVKDYRVGIFADTWLF